MHKITLFLIIFYSLNLNSQLNDDSEKDLTEVVKALYKSSCYHKVSDLKEMAVGKTLGSAFSQTGTKVKFGWQAKMQVLRDESNLILTERKASGAAGYFETVRQTEDTFVVKATVILTDAQKFENQANLDSEQGFFSKKYVQDGTYFHSYYVDEEYNRLQSTIVIKCNFLIKLQD